MEIRVKNKISIFIVFIILCITGCASTSVIKNYNLKSGEPVVEKEKHSYFYGSCQRPFMGLFAENGSGASLIFNIQNLENKAEDKNDEIILLTTNIKKKEEKELYVFKIKPGKYQLNRVALGGFSKQINATFEVKENTSYYFGYIIFKRGILNVLSQNISVDVSNDEQIDKKKLIENFKELEKSKFEIIKLNR